MISVDLIEQAVNQGKGTNDLWSIAFQALAVVGAVLGALGATIGFALTRYWNIRDRRADQRERAEVARNADRAKQRDILYESLKWFEGGIQKRSIGIAVVNTSWTAFPEFQGLWIEVFVNQAIYLLSASDQKDKSHEHDNLRRIMELVVSQRALVQRESRDILLQTIESKLTGQITEGLTLTPNLKNHLTEWKRVLGS